MFIDLLTVFSALWRSWAIFRGCIIYLQLFYCQYVQQLVLVGHLKQILLFVHDQESRTCSVPSTGVPAVGCRIPRESVHSRPLTKASDSAWLKGSPCPSHHPLSCPDRRTWWRLARARSLQVGYLSFYPFKSIEMSGHQQFFGWAMGCTGLATAAVL